MAHFTSSSLLLLLSIIVLSITRAVVGVPRTAFHIHKYAATKSVKETKDTFKTPKPSPTSPSHTADPSEKTEKVRMEDYRRQSHPCYNPDGSLMAPNKPECQHMYPYPTPPTDASMNDPNYHSSEYHYNDYHSYPHNSDYHSERNYYRHFYPGSPGKEHPYDDFHHDHYYGDSSYSSGYGQPHGYGQPYNGNPHYAYDHDYHNHNSGYGSNEDHHASIYQHSPHGDFHNDGPHGESDDPDPTPFAESFTPDSSYHLHDYHSYDNYPGHNSNDDHEHYHNQAYHNQPHYSYPMPTPDNYNDDPYYGNHYDHYHPYERAACGDDFYSVELLNITSGRLDVALQTRFGQRSICRTELHSFKSAALAVPAFCPRRFSRVGNVCVRDKRACHQFNRKLTSFNILKFETPCIRELECDYGAEMFKGKCYNKCPYGFYRKDTGAKSRCVKPVYFRPLCDDKNIFGDKCLEPSASGRHDYHHWM